MPIMNLKATEGVASDLVALVSAHRRDHCCGSSTECLEEERLIELARSRRPRQESADARAVMGLEGLRSIFPGLSTHADLEAADALRHRAAVIVPLVLHCAGALYYRDKGEGACPWSVAPYDEREKYINTTKVVLGAEEHFRQRRRS